MKLLLLLLLIINAITFLLMGIDKMRAKKEAYRISEKVLIMGSFAMGALGVGLGMLAFHHKTQKAKFLILVPLALVFNAAVIYALFYFNIV